MQESPHDSGIFVVGFHCSSSKVLGRKPGRVSAERNKERLHWVPLPGSFPRQEMNETSHDLNYGRGLGRCRADDSGGIVRASNSRDGK